MKGQQLATAVDLSEDQSLDGAIGSPFLDFVKLFEPHHVFRPEIIQ
jgi:hypothetical protein